MWTRVCHFNRLLLSVFSITITACLPAASQAQYAYDIFNVGSLGGATYPKGINNSGQVCGFSYTTVGLPHAFYYNNSSRQIQDVTPQDKQGTSGVGINDSGQIAIDAYANLGVYNANTQTTRTLTTTGNNIIHFRAINNSGDIVFTDGGDSGLYHYNTASFEYPLSSGTDPNDMYAINNKGELAGTISQVAGYYSNGVFTTIGALPGNFLSEAYGNNDNGDLCGQSDYQQGVRQHAFLYHSGQIQDLGTLSPNWSSGADDVNNAGVVVGGSGNLPFVYQNGQMQNLFSLVDPASGWTDGTATAVNDQGWIVGHGNQGGFLAIPHKSAVPAPGSLLVCGLGGGLLMLRLRRKRFRQQPG